MPLLDLFFSVLWIFIFIAWIWTVVSVVADALRSDDLGGLGKAIWVLFIIVVPWLGVLTYLIARGSGMAERSAAQLAARDQAMKAYIQDASGGVSTADELKKLADLKAAGVLTDEEFEAQKQKLLV